MPNNRGTRALFITTDYPPDLGGLQTYSYRIARDLPGGLLVRILVGTDHPRESLPAPAPGVALSRRRGRTRWQALGWGLGSIPYARFRWGADLLLHMQWTTAIPSFLLRRLGTRTRYMVLVHGAELLDPGRPLLGFLRKAVLQGADAVVAGSRHTAEIVTQSGVRCRRLEVIPYGNPLEGAAIPPRPAPGSAGGTQVPRLLCMHRLVPRKGTSLLLAALSGLASLPWSLDIVGRGEEEAILKRRAQALGLGERVRFLAPVPEKEKIRLLGEADLFILPSLPPIGNNHVEGLGLTLLEAQSMGLPVLAARTGGIPEAVQEGITGVLFRAGDPEDLREKLASLLQAPDRMRDLGAAGPEWVRGNFDWGGSLRRLAGLMEEVGGEP